MGLGHTSRHPRHSTLASRNWALGAERGLTARAVDRIQWHSVGADQVTADRCHRFAPRKRPQRWAAIAPCGPQQGQAAGDGRPQLPAGRPRSQKRSPDKQALARMWSTAPSVLETRAPVTSPPRDHAQGSGPSRQRVLRVSAERNTRAGPRTPQPHTDYISNALPSHTA